MATIRVVVTGLVQRVGFRAFVQRAALSMGIRGEVWNRFDGTVEAIAQHDSLTVLSGFVERIARVMDERDGLAEDIREILIEAEEAEFSKKAVNCS